MSELALGGAMERFVLALGGGLGLIVAAERHRLGALRTSTLFLRWRTWAISAPLFAVAAVGPAVAGALFVLALSVQGTREFARVTRLPARYGAILLAGCVASAAAATTARAMWLALPTVAFFVASLIATLGQDADEGHRRVATTLVGFMWVPWLLGFFILVKTGPLGVPLLLAVGMAVALSDVCAFALGSVAGRHPLAPRLSPAKTWEGAAGNLIGAYLGFVLMWSAFSMDLPPALYYALPAVIATGCLWGDLFESLVKRHCGVKDTGSWLPGFGGLLDRIDSLLFALPLVYGVTAVLG